MEKRDYNIIKEQLIEKKNEIIKKIKHTLKDESQIDSAELSDELDMASSEYLLSLSFRLRGRERLLLNKINKALLRIESDEYGICTECEEEINIKRLIARPVTNLCISCKEDQEQEEKQFL